jgi:carbon storage regulator CsrA
MLVLNRRVGESIYIGDDVCVTVFDRLRDHTTIGVLAPPAMRLRIHDVQMRPKVLEGGAHFYLLTLVNGQGFVIGDADVRVKFKGSGITTLGARPKQVRVAIQAPAHIQVHREEIYTQIRAGEGRRSPTPTFAKRLQQANALLSREADAMPPWASVGMRAPANAEFIFV